MNVATERDLQIANEFDTTIATLLRMNGGSGGYSHEAGPRPPQHYRWGAVAIRLNSPLQKYASFAYFLEPPSEITGPDLVSKKFHREEATGRMVCTREVAVEEDPDYIVEPDRTTVLDYTVEDHEFIKRLVGKFPPFRDWFEPDLGVRAALGIKVAK